MNITTTTPVIAAVVIGRNEGARLVGCLASLTGSESDEISRIIYVDSGSTDGSVEAARAAGAEVVELNMDQPFTAARARNAGLAVLQAINAPDLVQFVDGDCTVRPGWIGAARAFFAIHPKVAVVSGRCREQFPDASIYNRLCDREWDTPIGQAKTCGGNAMMRMEALDQIGGFDPRLIAGEEPELCVRLRINGWKIWRINAEMVLHDAAMTRFGQFWKRARRGGHARAEGVVMHGAPPVFHCVAGLRRALTWGFAFPVVIVVAALKTPFALLGLLIYPAKILQLGLKDKSHEKHRWKLATLLVMIRFPEAQGALEYFWKHLIGKRFKIMEYK